MPLFVLATEDELSEAIGLKIISHVAPGAELALLLRRGGSGYLRSNLAKFTTMCRSYALVMLTDLDQLPCAGELIARWTGGRPLPENFLLRVAVREVESWLLADDAAMTRLLGAVARRIPNNCDEIADPKQVLLNLARRAPRDVAADLCVAPGAVASQGLGYNARLCKLVREEWNPEDAASRSASLQRACRRLAELA